MRENRITAADQENNACKNKDSHVENLDENADRGNWSNKREYLLSMIGYAVGLGNVWRFPYLAYKHGGGAFLIPYVIMLSVSGLPLFFMESSVGQFCSQGPINMWKAVPILQVPIAMERLLKLVRKELQQHGWSLSLVAGNVSMAADGNRNCSEEAWIRAPSQSASEQYWDKVALQRANSMDETGSVVWHLALCLLLSWILIAAALYKGIKSSGKVVYFTATFPYAVLIILLIRGVTLEGARDGIEYYIGSQSNLTKLAEAEARFIIHN
ncbi:sodium- and chloride-dependent neutral and basic amino acid transporter B(0+) [Clarias magur]|uniref:Transporter n=1 Tax=Clarias magur TaxID=1594786 RepID=A0A8J4WXR2_CLAMG|nr:sodium- and chloride-dependent neutral and basic amino acid transporter B(0+) [Clarias magur]